MQAPVAELSTGIAEVTKTYLFLLVGWIRVPVT